MADQNDLIAGLNRLLEMEYVAMIHYVQHSASVSGPHYEAFSKRLRQEALDEMDHAVILTQAILALGGQPEWNVGSSHPFSAEEARDVQVLLRHDLQHEFDLIDRYVEVASLCQELGEFGLKAVLEEILADEQKEAHELERIIGG